MNSKSRPGSVIARPLATAGGSAISSDQFGPTPAISVPTLRPRRFRTRLPSSPGSKSASRSARLDQHQSPTRPLRWPSSPANRVLAVRSARVDPIAIEIMADDGSSVDSERRSRKVAKSRERARNAGDSGTLADNAGHSEIASEQARFPLTSANEITRGAVRFPPAPQDITPRRWSFLRSSDGANLPDFYRSGEHHGRHSAARTTQQDRLLDVR